jgi:hypothetical protein
MFRLYRNNLLLTKCFAVVGSCLKSWLVLVVLASSLQPETAPSTCVKLHSGQVETYCYYASEVREALWYGGTAGGVFENRSVQHFDALSAFELLNVQKP